MAEKGKKKKPAKRRLTPKRERFIENVLSNGGNVRKAALDAGYAENTANVTAYRMLENTGIQERIRRRIRDAQVTTDEIIGTLASHMRGCVMDVFDEKGQFDLKRARRLGIDHLVKKVKVRQRTYLDGFGEDARPVEETVTEFEFYDAQAAAKQLCAVFGLNKEEAKNPENQKLLVEKAIEQFMQKTGADREAAIRHLAPHIPELSEYVN